MRPGLRDELITEAVRAELEAIADDRAHREELDPGEAAHRLGRHLARVATRILEDVSEDERPARQVELANELLSSLSDEERIGLPPEVLLGVVGESPGGLGQAPELPARPEIPLSMSDLLFNGAGQPTIGSELRLELGSAERVDLLCAFVIWSGVRVLKEQLAGVVERGGSLRVITTTYMAATEPKALNALVELGAQVKVAFDARITKLHAKSWLLERPGGLSTAFVGSSNLSHTALHEGLEWNVRLSEMDAPHLLARVRATFDAHWADDHFEDYDPSKDAARLRRALGEDARRRQGDPSVSFVGLDVHPYPHQRRMLERLAIERERHDRHRNLIVAATGTGKTVVAALDYRNLRQAAGRDLSLLFVAHRRRILDQSRHTFRAVLRDGSFGEILGDGERPEAGHNVFAMIQSLDNETIAALASDAYDVVIVDEFHHAAAPTYSALLERLAPRELVGLTATPERMDGQDVTDWFGGRIAVELRLWEAIDQGFLAPFEYFGVSDGTDLSQLEWRRGGYLARDLDRVLTGDDARVAKLLEAIKRIADDPLRMRALGFCVSVEHAVYMAERFTRAGLPSIAISGATPAVERDDALRRLASGELRVVFSVDVLGEGVDVPTVDTVLLLRPTQSATVLTQQLGRGLRRAEGKRCLTVIDLIGQQHRQFRFDARLRALVDPTRGPVRQQVEDGFPLLPAGCEVSLDRVSREIVLNNLRDVARLGQWRTLTEDLRGLGDVSLETFLAETDRSPADLYRGPDRSWMRLRRDAGLATPASAGDDERGLLRAVGRLLHLDDPERVRLYLDILGGDAPPDLTSMNERDRRLLAMLHFGLWGVRRRFKSLADGYETLWTHRAVRAELTELLTVLAERGETVTRPLGLAPEIPVSVHASYGRDEVLAAFGVGDASNPPQLREGVRWVEGEQTDLFFITLHKSEREYSPTTMYRDYAISPSLFHWESQSTLREGAPTAQRYIHHKERRSHVLLFARDRARTPNGSTAPYLCLGSATYVDHKGERPLAITWQLREPMPESLFEVARAVAAA